jgi:hypothetical protein
MYNDSLFNAFARSFEARSQTDMSMQEYLESCRADPMRYANAAERLLAAIGEPQMIDTAKDPRLGRIFLNRTVRQYPAFAGFYGSPDGMAGAEELHLAQQRAEARAERNGSGAAPRPVRYADESSSYSRMAPLATSSRLGGAGRATDKQIAYAERLLKESNQPPPDDLTTMSSMDISRLIDSLRQG